MAAAQGRTMITGAKQCDETLPCPECADGRIVVYVGKYGTKMADRCPKCRRKRRAAMQRARMAPLAALRRADPNRIDHRRNRPKRMEPCAVCSEPFYFRGGPKSSKTCGKIDCSKELMRRSSPNFKGDAASAHAARGRSASVKSGTACERCGSTADGRRRWIERHHIDENVFNNTPENIAVLCKPCHRRAHGVSVRTPQPCKTCGEVLPSGSWDKARRVGVNCWACSWRARRSA